VALFGGKELSELRQQVQAGSEEIARLKQALAAAEKRVADFKATRQTVEDEREALRARLDQTAQAVERARGEQKKAEQLADWASRRLEGIDARIEAAETARAEAETRKAEAVSESARLRGENERLKSDVERLRLEAGSQRPAREERPRREPVASEAGAADELANLKLEIDRLRRRLAEALEQSRVALRKAEHNRRAYLVTQMQLDLAEDRLHLITHGTPRPVHREYEESIAEGGPVEAEDVEGFEDEPAFRDPEPEAVVNLPDNGALTDVPTEPNVP
jgi:chromosome segregation ATPase